MYVDLIQRPTEVTPVTYLYLIIFWMTESLRKSPRIYHNGHFHFFFRS